MNTAKIYQDSDGNDCSITQMVNREPDWAANRIQEGEAAIAQVQLLRDALNELVQLNDLKERLDFHEEYDRRAPAAWQTARNLLLAY